MAGFLFVLAVLTGLLLPDTARAALGGSRLFPARHAPGVVDLMDAELIVVGVEAGVENVIVEMTPAGGEISGRIVAGGDDGLAGVWVVAESGNFEVIGLTGVDGTFSLAGVPSGNVYLRASTDDPSSREQRFAAGYYPDAVSRELANPLQLSEAQSLVLPDWSLQPGTTLRGQVLAGDTQDPVPDVVVKLHRDGDGRSWQRHTDTEGRFSFRGLVPGSYRVGAVPDRGTLYLPSWTGDARSLPEAESLQLDPGADESVVLNLDPGASIRGQLRSEGVSLPLPQLLVQAISRESREIYETVSDDLGFFEVRGLPAPSGDSYFVYCPPMNTYYPDVPREEDARRISVVEGETVFSIDIVGFDPRGCQLGNDSRGVITGALDVDFSRLEGGLLTAWSEEDTVHLAVSGSGFYSMDCVPVGDYRIGFVPQGPFVTQYWEEAADLGAATTVAVDADTADGIRFEPLQASWIAGVVRETDGAPISKAIVTILDRDGRVVADGRADEQGAFRIDRVVDGSGLPVGAYYVRAESTVVADPEVTPVLQPTVSFFVESGMTHLSWILANPWWWELKLHRTDLDEGRTERLWHEPARPNALSQWVDRPGPGRFRYRLDARAFSTEGVPESSWIEIWTETAELWPLSAPRAWPSPWDGTGVLTFGNRGQESSAVGSLEIVSATGRRVRTLSWKKEDATLSWDGTDSEGRAVSSGVYFARRRTERGGILSDVVVVIQR